MVFAAIMAVVTLASCAKQPAATGSFDRPQLLSVDAAATSDPGTIANLQMQEPQQAMPARWVMQACIGESPACAEAPNTERID